MVLLDMYTYFLQKGASFTALFKLKTPEIFLTPFFLPCRLITKCFFVWEIAAKLSPLEFSLKRLTWLWQFPSLKSSMGATALPAISFAVQALSAMERFYIFALRIPAFSLSACKPLIHPSMFSSNSTFSNIASAPQLQFLKQNKFFSLLVFYFALCTHPYCLSNCITLNLGFAGHPLTYRITVERRPYPPSCSASLTLRLV